MNSSKMKAMPAYRIGDLLWCREGRRSQVWWPAMVTYEPRTGIYFRAVGSQVRQYHVQYFGISAVRGWVYSQTVQEYKHVEEKRLPTRAVSKSKRREFEAALQEVTEASSLDHKNRKLKFIFSFPPEPPEEQPSSPSEPPIKQEPTVEAPFEKTAEMVAKSRCANAKTRKSSKRRRSQGAPSSSDLDEDGSQIVKLRRIDIGREHVPTIANESLVSAVTNEKEANKSVAFDKNMEALERTFAGVLDSGVTTRPMLQTQSIGGDALTSLVRQPLRRSYRWAPLVENSCCFSDTSGAADKSVFGLPGALPLLAAAANAAIEASDCASEASSPASITSAILTPPSSSADDEGIGQVDSNPASSDLPIASSVGGHGPGVDREARSRKRRRDSRLKNKGTGCSFKSGTCSICDARDARLLACEGHCLQLFHLDCLGLSRMPGFPFVCDECLTVSAECYACKSCSGPLLACSRPRCSKAYHLACAEANRLFLFDEGRRRFVCPLHHCARCTSIGLRDAAPSRAELLQCVQCPLALHKPDCLVAGCELLGSGRMVCYQHLSIERRVSLYGHLNLNTCLECGDTGSLVCCDRCSAAYHIPCLEPESLPTPDTPTWKCPSCAVHDLSTYGSMVLAKFGKWRWWPAEVVHPDKVPDNLLSRKPGKCMFVIKFCGSHDYAWTYHGRSIPFVASVDEGEGEGERRSGAVSERKVKSGSRRNGITEGAFEKAHKEAVELYRSKVAARERRREQCRKPESKAFIRIKSNKYLVTRPLVGWADYLPCQCTPDNPCNDESTCFNRASLIECNVMACPLRHLCQNQRMQKNQYADTYPFYTGSRGWGLKARHDIARGDFVVEYVGEILDTEMCHERLRRLHENHGSNFYMLTLEPGLVIDASRKSNHARFVNHSCDPNCETQKWTVRGETRIGIFACKDVPAGVELTFDYQLDSLGNEKKRCLCGSKNCSGFIGTKQVKPPRPTSGAGGAAAKSGQKRREKPTMPKKEEEEGEDGGKKKRIKRKWSARPLPSVGGRVIIQRQEVNVAGSIKEEKKKEEEEGGEGKSEISHDDDCFICGDGGTLLMCDREGCSKSYHLQCVTRKLTPAHNTRWECPRHYCKTCQKGASASCSLCPTSYCERHEEGSFVDTESGPKCLLNCVKKDHPVEAVQVSQQPPLSQFCTM